MSHPCSQVLVVLCPMEFYKTPTVLPYAVGPDDVGHEQRILVVSPVEGVEVEGAVQREQAQSQPQIEEVSHDERRGRGNRTDRHDERQRFPCCERLCDTM